MKPWNECLNQESRAAVMQMCMQSGVSIIQVRSKTNQSIKADALRPAIVRLLHKRKHTAEEICEALNRGRAWVSNHLPNEPLKESFTFRKGVKQTMTKVLSDGRIRVEEV